MTLSFDSDTLALDARPFIGLARLEALCSTRPIGQSALIDAGGAAA